MNPRPYAGLADLERIQQVMRDGLRHAPYGYMHPGDVEWWLFYNPLGEPPEQSVHLWETPDGACWGWVFYLSRFAEYDLWLHPAARGTALEREMLSWAEAQLLARVTHEQPEIECATVFDDHLSLHALLIEYGYTRQDFLTVLAFDLTQPLPTPTLPAGFSFLDQMEPAYAELRADVHRTAFTGSRMTGDYYQAFMTSAPGYHPARDVVVVAPDGRFAAFALTWIDAPLRRGEFEPVGTRPCYQRQGLGRAVMWEGLRRLQALGMTSATVCCQTAHSGTVAFYQACGFRKVNTVSRFSRRIR
ncbi:MAG: GNAT family N-acetyltransferase [Anaerolineae bacterium]